MNTLFILGNAGDFTVVICTDGDRWVDVTDQNGFFDGIDIYADDATDALKKYFEKNSFNDFDTIFMDFSTDHASGKNLNFDEFENYEIVGEIEY